MKLPNWVYRFVGTRLSDKLDLKEGIPVDTKKWYQSKTIWSGVATILFGTYELTRAHLAPNMGWALPEIPSWVLTILGGMGIYGRMVGTKQIS